MNSSKFGISAAVLLAAILAYSLYHQTATGDASALLAFGLVAMVTLVAWLSRRLSGRSVAGIAIISSILAGGLFRLTSHTDWYYVWLGICVLALVGYAVEGLGSTAPHQETTQ